MKRRPTALPGISSEDRRAKELSNPCPFGCGEEHTPLHWCRPETSGANAAFDLLAKAAGRLGRTHIVGVLKAIEIPTGEGFEFPGETVFGFWATSKSYTDRGFARFERAAIEIVADLNSNGGARIVANINDGRTSAILHALEAALDKIGGGS